MLFFTAIKKSARGGDRKMAKSSIIVNVLGIPKGIAEPELIRFSEGIKRVLAGIGDFEIIPENVYCFFPSDRMETGLGEEVFFEYKAASGTRSLLDADWRTVAHAEVKKIATSFFPNALIERIE